MRILPPLPVVVAAGSVIRQPKLRGVTGFAQGRTPDGGHPLRTWEAGARGEGLGVKLAENVWFNGRSGRIWRLDRRPLILLVF